MCFPWDASEMFHVSAEQWTGIIQHRKEIHCLLNNWIISQWLAPHSKIEFWGDVTEDKEGTEITSCLLYIMLGIQILEGGGDKRPQKYLVCLLSHVWLSETPQTVACQAALSMGFPRQEYWSGLPFPPPRGLPQAGTEPASPALVGRFFTTKNKSLKASYDFILTIILTTAAVDVSVGRKGKKTQKNLQSKSKQKNNIYLSWVTGVRILFLTWIHRPPHLPRIPCIGVLISGLGDGEPYILLWSSSFVFLLPISTTLKTSAFSFVVVALVVGWWVGFTVGSLNDLFIYSIDTESS